MVDLGKKGDLWKLMGILIVIGLLFGAFVAYFALAETAEEEKARLEVELGQLEGQLAAIDGGMWVNYSTCGIVQKVLFNNWNCDGSIGYHVVRVLTPGVHNQRFNFSNQIADAHNFASAAGGTTNGSIGRFVDDTDTDFEKGNLSINVSVVGTGAGANLTMNISSLQNQTQNLQGRGISVNASTVLYLRFEEGTGQYANDSSLYKQANGTLGANNGAASDDPIWNSSTKFNSFGLSFNGNDFVDYGKPSILNNNGNETVEMWVKFDSLAAEEYLYADFDAGGSISQGSISAGRPTRVLGYYHYNNDATSLSMTASTSIDIGVWNHVAFVRDDTAKTVKLYLNGVQDKLGTYAGKTITTDTSAGNKVVGRAGSYNGNYVTGTIDEVSIWNVSLDNATILNHYQKGWGYFNTSNFTSQVFDANKTVNWNFISWSVESDDKGISNQYQSDISDLINASTVLYMKFNNDTLESERQLNVTYNISNEVNLVLYMPFDSANAKELTPNGSTVLLFHFNNDTGTGESASLFYNNATFGNGSGIVNGSCSFTFCPYYNNSDAKLGQSSLRFNSSGAYVNISINGNSNKSLDIKNSITMEGWIKPIKGSQPGDGGIINKGPWDEWPYYLAYVNNDRSIRFRTYVGSLDTLDSNFKVPDNEWHHVAGVYDGSTKKIYIDGVLDKSAAYTGSLSSTPNEVFIGRIHGGSGTNSNMYN
ncbi:MAG: LamG domain-containing protein [Nanoarchaeota archaeon]